MGAEVIQLERPVRGRPATSRRQLPTKRWERICCHNMDQERRNSLRHPDFSKPEGRAIFKLVQVCDIWMESSKPGSYSKWNLTDDVLQTNPKL
jgi:crotonobetainyl-CoA:carnitine CoA-transferase CaiB-like acyl-CoA transferase